MKQSLLIRFYICCLLLLFSSTTNKLIAQYCIPTSTYGPRYNVYINSVSLGDINNLNTGSTAGPNYNDYTALSTSLENQQEYTLIITGGSYYYNVTYYAWIDYNQDGDFLDSGEKIGQHTVTKSNESFSMVFTVPAFTKYGSTRMRITCVYNIPAYSPCNSYDHGETEDYTVILTTLFEEKTSGLPQDMYAFSLADSDNDGDYDLFLQDNLYTNNGSASFSLETSTISGISSSGQQWGDYNNDGYQDILIFNRSGIPFTKIMTNNQDNTFSELSSGIDQLGYSYGAWSDLNNDGLLDVIYTGDDINYEAQIRVYQNLGDNTFEKVETNISPLEGKVELVDYNIDGLKDILLHGFDINGNKVMWIYKNLGGFNFKKIETDMRAFSWGDIDWGDYDNDGDPDLILLGNSQIGSDSLKIYENIGNDNFTEIFPGLPELILGSVRWGDYDNDGKLDVIAIGKILGVRSSVLFKNLGNNNFQNIPINIPGTERGILEWADLDGDNDLDIFILGMLPGDMPISKCYINNTNNGNTIPSPITASDVVFNGDTVSISWTKSTDTESSNNNLSYNICLGNQSGVYNLISPAANISNGEILVPEEGNAGINNFYKLIDLNPDTYYYKVQAVDNMFKASAFSNEFSFIKEDLFSHEEISESYYSNQIHRTKVYLADIDNNNALDFYTQVNRYIDFFNNLGNGNFQEQTSNLPYTERGDMSWGDIDHDGDLDILMIGKYMIDGSSIDNISKIYENNGSWNFTEYPTSLIGVEYGSCFFADLDNDGDLDIAYTGRIDLITGGLYIYENVNGDYQNRFTDLSFEGENSRINYTDIDKDGDFDILLCAEDLSAIYYNDAEFNFTKSSHIFSEFSGGDIIPGDYNSDGYIDILVFGADIYGNKYTNVFQNTGTSFIKKDYNIRGISIGDASWIDIDNDFDLDIVISGVSSNRIFKIYEYESENDIYVENEYEVPNPIHVLGHSMGDVNNDRMPDVITSHNLDNMYLRINNSYLSINQLPAPSGLESIENGYGISILWNSLADQDERYKGVTYNVKLGTTLGGIEVIAPMSNTSTGFLLTPFLGNAQLNTFVNIDSLPEGKYYWSVQAIDQALNGGAWSEEQTFNITRLRPNFTADTVCHGELTNFKDTSLCTGTEIEKWYWEFGDGNSSELPNPTNEFKISGWHQVTLTITDTAGVQQSKTDSVLVLSVPEADFLANNVCYPNSIEFENKTVYDEKMASWTWQIDDTEFSTDSLPNSQNKAVGTYEIKLIAVAKNSCTDSSINEIQVAEVPDVSISVVGDLDFCPGDSAILYVGDSHNENYTYEWLKDGNNFGAQDTFVLKATEEAEYTVRIENTVASCVDTSDIKNVIVYDNPIAQAVQVDGNTTSCQNEPVSLYVDHTTGYHYQWYSDDGAVGTDSSKYQVTTAGTNTYYVNIINEHECENLSSNTKTVVINSLPELPSISQSGNACDSIKLIVPNNTDYTYQWMKDGLDIENATDTIYYVSDIGNANYTLRVTNGNGCSKQSENIAVTIKPKTPQLTITAASEIEFCTGNSVELSVPYNADYSYNWYRNGSSIEQHGNTYLATDDGSYTVEVNNLYDCPQSASNSIEVVTNDLPVIPDISQSGNACDSIKLSVPDNSDYTYQWEKDGTVIENAINNSYYVTDIGSTNYSLRVTNTDGCSKESEDIAVTIKQKAPQLSITAASETEFCDGGEVELSVPYNSEYTYNWLRNGGSIEQHENTYLASDDGTYTVEVNNLFNCPAISQNSVQVIVKDRPTKPIVSLSRTPAFCEGDSIVLTIEEQTGVSYQWMNGNTEISGANANEYVVYESGNYYIDVINTTTACSNRSDTTEVIVTAMPNKPTIAATNYNINDCPQAKIITLSVDNASNEYTYQWMKNGLIIEGATEYDLSDYLEEGNYSLLVSNQSCERESDNIAIVYNPELPDKPSIEVKGPAVWYLVCTNDQALQYEWYYENEKIQGADEYIYVPGENMGTYFVRIAEENGCFVSSDAVTIPITGVNDLDPFANLKIYPNPTPGMFTIEMDNEIYGELITRIFTQNAIEIFNIKYDKTTRHFKAQIDLSGQGKGIYIISLLLDKYKAERKLIVE